MVDTATQIPKPPSGAVGTASAQQFLRLPVDSARKLRYYDRPELNDLVTEHAKDMAALQAANAALRKVDQSSCCVSHERSHASGEHETAERVMAPRALVPLAGVTTSHDVWYRCRSRGSPLQQPEGTPYPDIIPARLEAVGAAAKTAFALSSMPPCRVHRDRASAAEGWPTGRPCRSCHGLDRVMMYPSVKR